MELLRAGLIDLVFANEDEAAALLEVLAAADGAAAGTMGTELLRLFWEGGAGAGACMAPAAGLQAGVG
jgi:hypothetical protein